MNDNRELLNTGSSEAHRTLLLLWLCFLLRAVFYSTLFPIWEGYDEYSHFAFVQHTSVNAALPAAAHSRVSKEIQESLKLVPLPWLLRDLPPPHVTHDAYWRLPESDRRQRQSELLSMPRDWARLTATENLLVYEAQQPPLYYWLLAPVLRLASNHGLPARVVLLRILSSILASLAIPLVFLAADHVLRNRNAALGVTALIAAMPELMVDVCRVGNDSLALLVYSWLLYLALRLVDDPGRKSLAFWLGLCLGLGLLTKAYFLTALFGLGVIAVCAVCLNRGSRGKILAQASLAFAVAAGVSGWWYWRNRAQTGSWSGLMQDVDLHEMPLLDLLRKVPGVDWLGALDSTFFSHIWFGNWSFLQVRSWMYHYFRCLALLSLLGLLILIARPWLKRAGQLAALVSHKHLLVMTALYAFFWLGLAYHVLITFVANGSSSSAGWYLYGIVATEVLLFGLGLFAALPRRLRPWALPVTTLSFSLLDLYTVHFLFIPYYAGLIAHKPNGALATFVVSRIWSEDLWLLPSRLLVNKPLDNILFFPLLWACYFAATVTIVRISFRRVRLRR